MAKKPNNPGDIAPPQDSPVAPPRMPEHGFTMQAAFEISHTVGELKSTITHLSADVAKLSAKVNMIWTWGLIVGTAITVTIGVSAFWIGGRFGDLMEAIAKVAAGK